MSRNIPNLAHVKILNQAAKIVMEYEGEGQYFTEAYDYLVNLAAEIQNGKQVKHLPNED